MTKKATIALAFAAIYVFYVAETYQEDLEATGLISNRKVFFASRSKSMNWWEAHRFCRQNGLELATIETQEETDVVHDLLSKLEVKHGYKPYWLGGSDIGRTIKDFIWFSNGRSVTVGYNNWHKLEPSNWRDPEHFMQMRTSDDMAKYHWNNMNGYAMCRPLCEMNLTAVELTTTVGNHPVYFPDVSIKANWYDAVRFCRQRGMRLAAIESSHEAAKFDAVVRSYGYDNATQYWTSGTNEGHKLFYWFSSGKDVTYSAWKSGKPGYWSNECLAVTVPISGASYWNGWTCLNQLNFVCEIRK